MTDSKVKRVRSEMQRMRTERRKHRERRLHTLFVAPTGLEGIDRRRMKQRR